MAEMDAWVMIPRLTKEKDGCIIDMRPLVLCKECEHCSSPADGVPFCKRIKRFVDADWFCADGKRAKEEA